MGKNCFVFVVCGPDAHINALNFSLRYIRHFSSKEVIVITDIRRNGLEIHHDNILDIRVPEEYDHHQASIYLKTSLHKLVDLDSDYCYLDSDVIAVDRSVDKVFGYSTGPVTFALDHCSLDQFSPNAVNCDCLEERARNIELLEQLEEEYRDAVIAHSRKEEIFREACKNRGAAFWEDHRALKRIVRDYSVEYSWFLNMPPTLQFILARIKPKELNFERFLASKGDYVWSDREKKVYDSHGNFLLDVVDQPPDYQEFRVNSCGSRPPYLQGES